MAGYICTLLYVQSTGCYWTMCTYFSEVIKILPQLKSEPNTSIVSSIYKILTEDVFGPIKRSKVKPHRRKHRGTFPPLLNLSWKPRSRIEQKTFAINANERQRDDLLSPLLRRF